MRVYVGLRDPYTEACRVWLIEPPARSSIHDLYLQRDELNLIWARTPKATAADSPWRIAIAEIAATVESQIIAAQRAQHDPIELTPSRDASAPLSWGDSATAAALAHVILQAELGEDLTPAIYGRFAEDVIVDIDGPGFRLTAQSVWEWIYENRALIERELDEPLPHPDIPSLSIPTSDTPTTEPPDLCEAAASKVVRACEGAWAEIQEHHPELPEVVMVLGSGVERGRLVKLGHWWAGRWVADGQTRGEVLLAGEALHLAPQEVFEVLLHEAAHGLNAARGIKDASRGGRYHNAHFAKAAAEVGLAAIPMPPYGFARTTITPEACERYQNPIERLGEVMRIARQIERRALVGGNGAETESGSGQETSGGSDQTRTKGRALAVCGCGRKLRVSPSVIAAGPIVCGLCEAEFTVPGAEPSTGRQAETETAGHNVVDHTFTSRRQAAIRGSEPASTELEHDRPTTAVRTAELEAIIRDAVEGLQSTPEDLVAASAWYEQLGTYDEQPMRARNETEAHRRSEVARAVLRSDGTLHGPDLHLGQLEGARGDRVVVTADEPRLELTQGTPGTVEVVDHRRREIEIDFATWGRLRAAAHDAVVNLLRHDYVEPPAHTQDAPEPEGIELGLHRSQTETER